MTNEQRKVTFTSNNRICDLCKKQLGQDMVMYDFRTRMKMWAYGCEPCWERFRLHPTLGVGKGQKYEARIVEDRMEWVKVAG